MEMIFIAIVGLIIYGHEAYQKLEHWLYVRKNYPEHIRDRNKALEVGQVWEDNGWTTTITAISANRVEYDYYVPKLASGYGGWERHSSDTLAEFRERINRQMLHLEGLKKQNQLEQKPVQKEVMYGPVEPPTKPRMRA